MEKQEKILTRYQNKVRGLISERKTSKIFDGKSIDALNISIRRGISELYFLARAELHPSNYEFFIGWSHEQIKSQVKDYDKFSKANYCDLAGLFKKLPKVTLYKEVLWMTSRIINESDKINAYTQLINKLQKNLFTDQNTFCISILEDFEFIYGASFSTIQLRMAFEQHINGLQGQKKYSAEVRSIYKQGLLPFIVHFTSVRNEEKTVFSRYIEEVKLRINNHKFYNKNSYTKNYLNYRLCQEWPKNEDDILDILMVEQTNSIFDIYDTLINFFQNNIYQNNIEYFEMMENTIIKLNTINDFRLGKLLISINKNYVNRVKIPYRDTEISDKFFFSELVDYKYYINKKIDQVDNIDVWNLFYLGIVPYKNIENNDNFIDVLISNLNNFIRKDEEGFFKYNQLLKIAINFNSFPIMKALEYFIELFHRQKIDSRINYWNIGLNSPTFGIEDISSKSDNTEVIPYSLTKKNWMDFFFNDNLIGISNFNKIIKSINLINLLDYEMALSILNTIDDEENNFSIDLRDHLKIECYYLLGNLDKLIQLISECDILAISKNRTNYLRSILYEFDESNFDSIDTPLLRSNLLNVAANLISSDDLLTVTRRSIKTVCNSFSVKQPSAIKIDSYDRNLIYFLSNVCIPSNLDMARIETIKNTKQVLNERIVICNNLRKADEKYSSLYEQEILSLRYKMTLDEGQRLIAASRIHVDIENFKKWGLKELEEDFERYLDLLKIEDKKLNFDYGEIFEEIINGNKKDNNFRPENDADALLLQIVQRLQNGFLYNHSFGLDFFLSKRIRHQSFIGKLRAPVEFSKLITTKATENGSYRDNEYWLDILSSNDLECRNKLKNIFNSFAQNFDAMLIDLKDNKLHLHTIDKPKGLIHSRLSTNFVQLLKLYLKNSTLQESLDAIIDVLWASLNDSLIVVRNYIVSEVSKNISGLFDSFKAQVKKELIIKGDDFYQFDTKISECNQRIQSALIEIGAWFTRSELEAHTKYISTDEIIKIAIDTAKKSLEKPISNLKYNVEVVTHNQEGIRVPFSNLPFLNDVFFILLDNVQTYSYLENPQINCSVIFDELDKLLKIKIVNDLHPKSKIKNQSTVNEIINIIEKKDFSARTRKEGKSGLVKLAAVTDQSKESSIKFGYKDNNLFEVNLELKFVMKIFEQAEDIDNEHSFS